MSGPISWKTRIDERRQQEESKKRIAATAVNDISFPAMAGAGGGAGSWGVTTTPRAVTTATTTTYAERLRASTMAGAATPDDAGARVPQTYTEFRHPRFGTSRSARNDTYYDMDDGYEAPPSYLQTDNGDDDNTWTTVDKRKTVVASSTTNRYDDADFSSQPQEQYWEEEEDTDQISNNERM
jgi:hypothetical protein